MSEDNLDQILSEEMANHNLIRVRGPDCRPDETMFEDPICHGSIRIRGPDSPPDKNLSSKVAHNAREPPIIEFSDDQDAWDTVIVCSLLGKFFGEGMSSVEIANALNTRNKHIGKPLTSDSVEHMLETAKMPSTQQRYPETIRYEKWAAVKDRLAARNGIGDGNDTDYSHAKTLYKDTLRFLRPVAGRATLPAGSAMRQQSNNDESERSLAEKTNSGSDIGGYHCPCC